MRLVVFNQLSEIVVNELHFIDDIAGGHAGVIPTRDLRLPPQNVIRR